MKYSSILLINDKNLFFAIKKGDYQLTKKH